MLLFYINTIINLGIIHCQGLQIKKDRYYPITQYLQIARSYGMLQTSCSRVTPLFQKIDEIVFELDLTPGVTVQDT
jgi:hypothetical protein